MFLLASLASIGSAQSIDTVATSAVAPLPAVQTRIANNEQDFLKAVLAKDVATIDAMLAEDLVYVHENEFISTKQQFLKDFVSNGYVESVLVPKQPDEPMRQYGDRVQVSAN